MHIEDNYILGYWKEYCLFNNNFPSIYDEKFDLAKVDSRILDYLSKGETLLIKRGFSKQDCRIRPNYSISYMEVMTDGVYIWSNVLLSYYKDLGILLPLNFVEHIYLNNFIIPIQSELFQKRYMELSQWVIESEVFMGFP